MGAMITLFYNNLLKYQSFQTPGLIINVFFHYHYRKVDFIALIFCLFFYGHQTTGKYLLSMYNIKGIRISNFKNMCHCLLCLNLYFKNSNLSLHATYLWPICTSLSCYYLLHDYTPTPLSTATVLGKNSNNDPCSNLQCHL